MPSLDITVLAAYALLLLGVSYLARRNESAGGFLIAERRLGPFASAFTIVASKIGGGLLITVSALAFVYGFQAMFLFVGFIAGYVLFYFFARRLQEESGRREYFTLPHYFEDRFGKPLGRVVAFLAASSTFGWVLTNLIGGAKLINEISGLPFSAAAACVAATVGIYIAMAGFKAVVRTDVIQFTALLVILLAIALVIVGAAINETSIAPPPVESLPLGQIIGFLLVGILFPLGSAELWERVYATRDVPTLQRSLVISSITYVVFGLMLIYVSLIIRGSIAVGDPDTGLITGLSQLVPGAMSSLVVVAFASAILSSADTFVYSTSAMIGQNLLSSRTVDVEQRMRRTRLVVLPVVLLGWVFSVIFADVINATVFFVSLTIGLAMLTIFSWSFSSVSAASMLAGALALIIAVVGGATVLGMNAALPMLGIFSVPIGIAATALVRKVMGVKATP